MIVLLLVLGAQAIAELAKVLSLLMRGVSRIQTSARLAHCSVHAVLSDKTRPPRPALFKTRMLSCIPSAFSKMQYNTTPHTPQVCKKTRVKWFYDVASWIPDIYVILLCGHVVQIIVFANAQKWFREHQVKVTLTVQCHVHCTVV